MLSDRQIQSEMKKCQAETVLNDGAGGKGNGSLVLVIRRRAAGCTANFYGQWWMDGARKRLPLGAYPAVTLGTARELYSQQVRDVLATGKNPRAMAVLAPTDRPTFTQLVKAYCDQMEADGKVSAAEVRRALDLAAEAATRGVPLVAITDSPFSPVAQNAKCWFEVVEADFEGFRSLAASFTLAATLTVAVAQRRRAKR